MVVSAWLLANAFSLVGMLAFHRLVWQEQGVRVANNATLLLLLYPGSVFLFVPYSESLFLLLAVICLLGLQQGCAWVIATSAFLLPMCRAIGIFILPVIALGLLLTRAQVKRYWVCLMPVLGYACYFGIMYFYTNNPFEGFVVQSQYPAQPSIGKIFDLSRFIHTLAQFSWSHDYLHSFMDRIVFITFLISLFWILQIDVKYYAYALLTGLVPAMSSDLMSYTRYAVLVFPLFIVWARFGRQTRTLPLLFMLFYGVQVLLLLLALSNHWAG